MSMADILTFGAMGGERAVRSLFHDADEVRRGLAFKATEAEERSALESMSAIWNRAG